MVLQQERYAAAFMITNIRSLKRETFLYGGGGGGRGGGGGGGELIRGTLRKLLGGQRVISRLFSQHTLGSTMQMYPDRATIWWRLGTACDRSR